MDTLSYGKSMKKVREWERWAPWVLVGVAVLYLFLRSVHDSGDFRVFWKSYQFWFGGQELYSVERDGIGAFKYPPWSSLFFVQWSFLSWEVARFLWAMINAFLLAFFLKSIRASLQFERKDWLIPLALLLSGGIWVRQFVDGQIQILVLASLWFFGLASRLSFGVSLGLLYFPSLKLVSAYPIVAKLFESERKKTWLYLGLGMLGFALLGAVVLTGSYRIQDWIQIYQDWWGAATSTQAAFGPEYTYGRMNQGFPALLVRLVEVRTSFSNLDLAASGVLILFFGIWAFRTFKTPWSKEESWAAWIALVPIVHPLSWWHTFVLAFPLQVLALDRAFVTKNFRIIGVAMLALGMTGFFTENSLGPFGAWLDFISVKSWGVVLSILVLQKMILARAKAVVK